ncbi:MULTISPECIES: hypothetical protein [Mycobacteriaceae]|uniref:Uncharacterized protein n=1 Tax=Mycolicibacterium goodii TaxID=134601 RepID=A0ABS6HYG0_MYCGD|nr:MULTISPECIES: hypothetical protein [Mycobacteriaceae]MBU8826550.1 hypothetical protein [Mycolicibacterium goodii]MBU8834223.1 hypothetical protein [Mycolicibacterium goodii]ULE31164.1 hypothetical protein K3G64_00305 [Mycobacterium sp. IDR2000157661]
MTPTPARTHTIVEIDQGTATPITFDLGTANEYGDFDAAAYEGNLYLSINGRLYGSLYIRHDAAAGHPTITLGQYDPATQQWEPRNEIGPELQGEIC